MRTYRRFTLLLWGLLAFLLAAHVAYLFHFFGWRLLWRFIHLAVHPLGWAGGAAMALSLLYIPRKKKWFTWGKVKAWYQFHVVMGLSGAGLVFLHAYGKYYGVGGLTLLVVWLVTATGVVGYFLFRRLPEEVALRAGLRAGHLERLERLDQELAGAAGAQRELLAELKDHSLLEMLELEKAGSKPKLPHPSLAKRPAQAWEIVREYLASGRRLAGLRRRVRHQARQQKSALGDQAGLLDELYRLERDARDLLLLNELYSLWRKLHVPLAWFLWVLAGAHLFAWGYY